MQLDGYEFLFFQEEKRHIPKSKQKQNSWRCAKGSPKNYSHTSAGRKKHNADIACTVKEGGKG